MYKRRQTTVAFQQFLTQDSFKWKHSENILIYCWENPREFKKEHLKIESGAGEMAWPAGALAARENDSGSVYDTPMTVSSQSSVNSIQYDGHFCPLMAPGTGTVHTYTYN